jgi:hypothetical protein
VRDGLAGQIAPDVLLDAWVGSHAEQDHSFAAPHLDDALGPPGENLRRGWV